MSKKTFIIITVFLGIIFASFVGYYFFLKSDSGTSTETSTKFFDFFPFGQSSEPNPITITTDTTPTIEPSIQNFDLKLRKISTSPVSGAGLLDVKVGTTTQMGTVVRHIEKSTGHIFETELFSPKQNRISNTTIPQPYETFWGNKNNSFIARYLKEDMQTIDTFSLTIKNTSTSTENVISGIDFPAKISSVSVLGNSVFYLQKNTDSSIGFTSTFDGKNKKQIWNSPIKDLLAQYISASTVALTTKPHQNLPGYLYFVSTGSGQVRKILGDIYGLSTLISPDTNKILYLEQTSNARMYVLDQNAKSTSTITPVTFPEKCVWSKKDKNTLYCAVPKEFINGNSLDDWYKGSVSFSDDIWKYDLKKNTSSFVVNLYDIGGEMIDVINPILSDSERYLVFMNKIDNTLWSLDLLK